MMTARLAPPLAARRDMAITATTRAIATASIMGEAPAPSEKAAPWLKVRAEVHGADHVPAADVAEVLECPDLLHWSTATTAAATSSNKTPLRSGRGAPAGSDSRRSVRREPFIAGGRPGSLATGRKPSALARYAQPGMRERFQPGLGDGVAATLAKPVRAFGDFDQSGVDFLYGGLGLSRKVQVQFSVDVGRTPFAALLVELDVTRLVLERERLCLCSQLLGLAGVVVALCREQRPLVLEEQVPGLVAVGTRFLGAGGDVRCLRGNFGLCMLFGVLCFCVHVFLRSLPAPLVVFTPARFATAAFSSAEAGVLPGFVPLTLA